MGAPKWSVEDVLTISVMVDFLTLKELSERMGRSEGAVRRKLHSLGLRVKHHQSRKKPPSSWSEDEIKYLKTAVKKKTIPEMASHLKRSVSSVNYKLRHLGIPVRSVRGYKRTKKRKGEWTRKETSFLRENVGLMTSLEISEHIKRTPLSIKLKATKMNLSLQINPWTESDFETLTQRIQEGVSFTALSQELGRSPEAVRAKARCLMIAPSNRWTDEENSTLLSLRDDQGLSFREISARLQKSVFSVRKKYNRLVKASHTGGNLSDQG
jgi:DNA-binding CsgD family transcriptional regulator